MTTLLIKYVWHAYLSVILALMQQHVLPVVQLVLELLARQTAALA